MNNIITVGISQIAPMLPEKIKTIEKIVEQIKLAGTNKCELLVFGEALLPGYPYWVELTDGAKFDNPIQKDLFAYYLSQAIDLGSADFDVLRNAARENGTAVYIGCVEKARDRGGFSLYCSLVYINQFGLIESVHRKLMPTHEERLVWAQGDGNGLRVHDLCGFTVGGLNCWENWMPLARMSLYAQGENLHVMVWPGNRRNTEDITRFVAKESRSFVVSASGLMRNSDFSQNIPHLDKILENSPEILADGGSCIAAPDGSWIIEPVLYKEELLISTLDLNEVRRTRQNFDVSGHYSRPDVLKLQLNRERQRVIEVVDR